MPGPWSQISWAQGSLKAILHCRQKCFKPTNNKGFYFVISEFYPILIRSSFILKSSPFVADIVFSQKKSRQCQTTKRKKRRIYWSTINVHSLPKKKENPSRPQNTSASYSICLNPVSQWRKSFRDGHGMAGNHTSLLQTQEKLVRAKTERSKVLSL